MRAIVVKRFGGPEELQFTADVAVPAVLGDQLRIKVKCAGVNPVDTYTRAGLSNIKPNLPFTPGNDGAGIVDACGPDVKNLKVGDRVYFFRSMTGSYADFCVTSEEQTFKLHDYLSFSQGASIGVPYFTAYRALIAKGKAKSGQSVLIHGASGAVGIACCQIAKHLGLQVLGTAGTAAGMKLAQSCGATHVFNHHDKDYVGEIKRVANSGVNIIVEMLANVNLEKDLDMVAENGIILIVGCRGNVEIGPRPFIFKELTVTGVALFRAVKSDWLEMGNFMDAGQQKGWILPVVGKEYKLEEARAAHEDVIDHKEGSLGKIVLNLG